MVNPSVISGPGRPIIPVELTPKPQSHNVAAGPAATALLDVSETLVNELAIKLHKHSENLTAARTAGAKLVATFNEGSADPSPKAKAALALLERISSGKLSGHLTNNAALGGLEFARSIGQQLSPELRQQMASDIIPGLAPKLDGALSDSGIKSPIGVRASFDDILDGLQDLIGVIKDDYLDVYARMVEAYAKLFAELNENVIGQLHTWLEVIGDKGAVKISAGAIRAELDKLIAKYSLPNADGVLFPVPGEDGSLSGSTREDAEKWRLAMGLPASCVKQLPDGSYVVVMDLAPIRAMKGDLPTGDKPELLPARFQAWQAAFNAQQQELESALQKHTQKYSNANSIHDNVQKVISSTLSALFEMLKAFSAALG